MSAINTTTQGYTIQNNSLHTPHITLDLKHFVCYSVFASTDDQAEKSRVTLWGKRTEGNEANTTIIYLECETAEKAKTLAAALLGKLPCHPNVETDKQPLHFKNPEGWGKGKQRVYQISCNAEPLQLHSEGRKRTETPIDKEQIQKWLNPSNSNEVKENK